MLLLCGGCGGTTIDTGSYDRKCTQDTDCTPVFQGDTCAACLCPNAAVRQSAATRYQQDLAAMRSKCGPLPAIACGPCSENLGLCLTGSCTLRAL